MTPNPFLIQSVGESLFLFVPEKSLIQDYINPDLCIRIEIVFFARLH